MADVHYHKLETGHWRSAMLLDMDYVLDLASVEVDRAGESSQAAVEDAE